MIAIENVGRDRGYPKTSSQPLTINIKGNYMLTTINKICVAHNVILVPFNSTCVQVLI